MTHKVAFFLTPQFSMMSLLSLTEPLRKANEVSSEPIYTIEFYASQPETMAVNGMSIKTKTNLPRTTAFKLVMICSSYNPDQPVMPVTLAWLRWLYAHGILLGSTDTGGYLLAQAGILGNNPLAMHWVTLPAFQSQFPKVNVSRKAIEISARFFTCAGATTGLDLMTLFLTQNHGKNFANKVENHFLYNSNENTKTREQSALTELLLTIRNERVRRAIEVMETQSEIFPRVGDIANQVGFTLRQMERAFKIELNNTPSSVYRDIRFFKARSLLFQTKLSTTEIAIKCGFASRTQFSAAFSVRFGTSPMGYRNSFVGNKRLPT